MLTTLKSAVLATFNKLTNTPKSAPTRRPAERRKAQLSVEALESREVMSVTYHGGAVLPHVELQNVYLGSAWSKFAYDFNQTGQLENFGRTLVQGSYMDMLTQVGYGVGRGSASTGTILGYDFYSSRFLTDSMIRADLQTAIRAAQVQQPDANRLYVLYVQANVPIQNDHDLSAGTGKYSNSQVDFTGYHGAFTGVNFFGQATAIRYAVIAYPGGVCGNVTALGLTGLNEMTMTASHEIAEAVTDPDVNYNRLGWYDDQFNGEIGDINRRAAVLQGFVVQTEINKWDQAMVPFGATLVASSFSANSHGSFNVGGPATGATTVLNTQQQLLKAVAHKSDLTTLNAVFSALGKMNLKTAHVSEGMSEFDGDNLFA